MKNILKNIKNMEEMSRGRDVGESAGGVCGRVWGSVGENVRGVWG